LRGSGIATCEAGRVPRRAGQDNVESLRIVQ
jgi:hypothetical protein